MTHTPAKLTAMTAKPKAPTMQPTLTFCGIDPSLTGTGVAFFVPGEGECVQAFGSNPAAGIRGRIERYIGLTDKIMDAVSDYKPAMIAIEGYSYGSTGGMAFDRYEFGGILRLRLVLDGAPIIEVPPACLKKFAAGKGNADKTAMALAVYKIWGVEFRDDNQTDAYALARFAEAYHDTDKCRNAQQREAVDAVKNPKVKTKKKKAAA